MTAATAGPDRLTQANFARHIGKAKSHVTALKKAGRLVLDEQGLVIVQASLERIAESTGAPERAAVVTPRFSEAREQKERYEAASAKRDFEESCRLLTRTERIAFGAANAGTQIRQRLEAMADTLAPQLAPVTDENQVRTLLADWSEALQAELAHLFTGLAGAARSAEAQS